SLQYEPSFALAGPRPLIVRRRYLVDPLRPPSARPIPRGRSHSSWSSARLRESSEHAYGRLRKSLRDYAQPPTGLLLSARKERARRPEGPPLPPGLCKPCPRSKVLTISPAAQPASGSVVPVSRTWNPIPDPGPAYLFFNCVREPAWTATVPPAPATDKGWSRRTG